MSYAKIRGFELEGGAVLVKWSLEGIWKRARFEDAIRLCEECKEGLDPSDIRKFRLAHTQYLAEQELGRKLPGPLRQLGGM